MSSLNLIVFSYHQFSLVFDEYQYSRTYDQFIEDLQTKDYDLITVDDAHWSCKRAFELMQVRNIRGMLFVPTSLIGKLGYLTWQEVDYISCYHEIGNHSHNHVDLRELGPKEITEEINTANSLIKKHTGKLPRFFVPPFNKSNKHVENVAEKFGMQIIKDRVDILNTSP